MSNADTSNSVQGVAIIGMAGRLPGASNLGQFWRNLVDGVESVTFFSDEELIAAGTDPSALKASNYVKAACVLKDVEMFDASFFGFSPREAEIMDPQYRLFLESSWEAIEKAGYDSESYEGVIGIFAGMSMNRYLLSNLLPNRELIESEGALQIRILNDKDFLASLTAYKMNLRGPSLSVQTACSTSLVAVNLACQSLLNYQTDIAIAGGVSVAVPHKSGYLSKEGVFSPDGHCRAFDAKAEGTVSGSGVGAIVLKRLEEAIADGDHIHAVVKGSAINNDGSVKVGYTAPSVDGQAEVIAMAQALAEVDSETITYIEAHGTGTPMGDPIEVAALTRVFRASTDKKRFCALGSVKTNIGHLDAAAGVASLIKVALALENKTIPPSLNFQTPNPDVELEESPFYVNTNSLEWLPGNSPRRAGVSSFAVGGVNAHVVVEEAPAVEPSQPSRPWQLLLLSARTEAALESATQNLVEHLKQNPSVNLADVAYTLQVGRKSFDHRRMVACRDVSDAIACLGGDNVKRTLTGRVEGGERAVVFMFPGLGNQYVNMALDLYLTEPTFRQHVDRCSEILKPHLNADLRDVMFPASKRAAQNASTGPDIDLRKMLRRDSAPDESAQKLNETLFAQPALFVIEYALAQLWRQWGVRPRALLGYSIGEYVAACVSGVLSLEDALFLVAKRAQMIQALRVGAMLAVPLSESEAKDHLNQSLSIAAVNTPSSCVISGTTEAVSELQEKLSQRGLACQRLLTTHAFHSRMMEPIREPFTKLVGSIKLNAPEIPYISNVTGSWITPAQATDPAYWAEHMCKPVRFADGVREVSKLPDRLLLEAGCGQTLSAWAMQVTQAQGGAERMVFSSLRHAYENQSDQALLLNSLGKLWLAGVEIDWAMFYGDEKRRRVQLPTYPFERQRYWVEPPKQAKNVEATSPSLNEKSDLKDWFYVPVWKQSKLLALPGSDAELNTERRWLIFADDCGYAARLAGRIKATNQRITIVIPGQEYERINDSTYKINPVEYRSYEALIGDLLKSGETPTIIAHLWNITAADSKESRIHLSEKSNDKGFVSLLLLAQSLASLCAGRSIHIAVVSNDMQKITGHEELHPEKATLLGPCKVIPHEYPNVSCQSIDITLLLAGSREEKRLIENLLAELIAQASDKVVAYRGDSRWLQTFEKAPLAEASSEKSLLKPGGVYLITGGLGGIGLSLAQYLAQAARAKLVLFGRSHFPAKEEWEAWLAAHSDNDKVSRTIRKLQSLEQAGAAVLTLSADVTNRAEVRAALRAAREKFGTIDGVIHAAGVSPGGLIEVKEMKVAAQVLAPKVRGTLVLEDALKDTSLDFFILCSSLASVIGGLGLVDHCGANSFLDAFAHYHSFTSDTATMAINWDAWLEVGQAANAELSGGLKHILKSEAEPVDHPLFYSRAGDNHDRQCYSTRFSTAEHWVLNEHRIMGNGVLPGTAYLEMVRRAFEPQAGGGPVEMRKVVFLSPLVVKDGEAKEAQTILSKNGDEFDFVVVSKADEHNGNGRGWQEHARGKVGPARAHTPKKRDIESILKAHSREEIIFSNESGAQPDEIDGRRRDDALSLGGRWEKLSRRVSVGENEALALIELPEEFAGDLDKMKLHPSMLDAATGMVRVLGEGLYLPLAYDRINISKNMPRKFYSYLRGRNNGGAGGDTLACDITIMDEAGNELIEIQEFVVKKINDLAPLQSNHHRPPDPSPLLAEFQQLAGGGINDFIIAEAGISPTEGKEALARILASGLRSSQIVVSTRELLPLMNQASALTKSRILGEIKKLQSSRLKHPRPSIATQYADPGTQLETVLVKLWQETLSLQQVGIYDNFFDLGGDSLLATQLILRINEEFHVDISLRTLFQSPTVADLAVVIVRKEAEPVGDDELAKMVADIKQLSAEQVQAMLADESSFETEMD